MHQTRLTVPPSSSLSSHLLQPPDRALWLGDLRLECFDQVMAAGEADLAAALAEHGRELPSRDLLMDALGLRVATPEVLRHLLLVARFLEHKKTAALEIVAREQLDEEVLEGWRTPGGRLHRLPVAILLYAAAPESLLALLLWDRWHSRRRVSWRLDSRHYHLPDLEPEDWWTIAERVLAELREDAAFQGLRLRAVLNRAETGELLFGLREPAHRAAVEADDGALLSGRTAGWLLLALSQDGGRLDVCDHEPARGVVFATRLLRAARGGEVRFAPAQDALDEARLADFLAAACDPEDDRLPLLEITARAPGRTDRQIVTVTGPGQARAERLLAELRRSMPLALSWRDVISLKVGFEGRYRFTLERGEEAGRSSLWYSDRERDKDVALRFEGYLRRTLGVSATPRPAARRAPREEDRSPQKGSGAWWRGLLSPVVDAPPPWMSRAWAELEAEGLLQVRRSATMGCGTPFVDTRACGLEEHDCRGEIELGWAEVNPADPLLQPPGAEAECPVCERVWRPGTYRLPLVERARVAVDLEQLGLRVFRAAASVSRLEPYDGEPGVFEARTLTGRNYLAFTPLLSAGSSFAPGQGVARRTAWVRLDEELGPGIPVSALLADPGVLVRAWGLAAQAEVGAAREPRFQVADPPRAVERPPGWRLSLRGSAVYLGEVPVLAGQARAQRALLAVFILLAHEDTRRGRRARRGHTMQQVLAEAALAGLHLDEVEARKQLSRMNAAARTALARAGHAPMELVEKVKEGYRLMEGVEAEAQPDTTRWMR